MTWIESHLNHLGTSTLEYWSKKLKGKSYRMAFLLTKVVEMIAFKLSHKSVKSLELREFLQFPPPKPNAINSDSKIAMVVPAYVSSKEDETRLMNLIGSSTRQSRKFDRIYVVDDSSSFSYKLPSHVTVIRKKSRSGPAASRNIGKSIAIQEGIDIIFYTDSDCVLSPDIASCIIDSFMHEKDYQILSGKTVSKDYKWFDKYHDINGTLNGRRIRGEDRLLYGPTCNLAITREVALNLDFDESFPDAASEDIEFCFRANMNGYVIKHIPSMIVYHDFGYTGNYLFDLIKFMKKFMKYAKYNSLLISKIPDYYHYYSMSMEISNENTLLEKLVPS